MDGQQHASFDPSLRPSEMPLPHLGAVFGNIAKCGSMTCTLPPKATVGRRNSLTRCNACQRVTRSVLRASLLQAHATCPQHPRSADDDVVRYPGRSIRLLRIASRSLRSDLHAQRIGHHNAPDCFGHNHERTFRASLQDPTRVPQRLQTFRGSDLFVHPTFFEGPACCKSPQGCCRPPSTKSLRLARRRELRW